MIFLKKSVTFLQIIRTIVATKMCKEGWKLEYRGYLMAGYHGHPAGTSYTCIDNDPESLHGGGNINSNGYTCSIPWRQDVVL